MKGNGGQGKGLAIGHLALVQWCRGAVVTW